MNDLCKQLGCFYGIQSDIIQDDFIVYLDKGPRIIWQINSDSYPYEGI